MACDFQVALVVQNTLLKTGNIRDTGSIPGSGGSPGGGCGNPLQYSCLENPMGRGAWPATVHGIAKSQTQLKRFSTYMHRTWLNVISRLSVLSWRQKRRVRDWSREREGQRPPGHEGTEPLPKVSNLPRTFRKGLV